MADRRLRKRRFIATRSTSRAHGSHSKHDRPFGTLRAHAALIAVGMLTAVLFVNGSARGQAPAGGPREAAANRQAAAAPVMPDSPAVPPAPFPLGIDVDQMIAPGGLPSTLKVLLLMTVISLAPSILIMTTCFIRFVVVLGLLRQALGIQQLPPNQVVISLCMFLTFLIMAPVWTRAYNEGIKPYSEQQPGQPISLEAAFQNTVRPLRDFMVEQIEATGNSDSVWTFLEFQRPAADSPEAAGYQQPENYDDVPLTVLLPAFMLSELKTSFVIGFQIYLPFLVIDMVVAAVLISMGMMMLPPVLISLPFKLLLFVLIDGWFLTVGMMLESVQPLS